tara:strand:- start:208 stop:885 length:678 start_codon:yes stop_codon:yes gene_type:complete
MATYPELIDIPFEHRHQCWFCGEPSHVSFTFPHSGYLVIACPHPTLMVPCCGECHTLARKAQVDDIWRVRQSVKAGLIKRYRKDLAIGISWTQEELANSGFEGGNFEGFQRSAWFMYEVAKDRVNYKAWPLSYRGEDLEEVFVKDSFTFDGVTYPSVDDAILHYAQSFGIKVQVMKKALAITGIEAFADAVRFCRLLVGATPDEIKVALAGLASNIQNVEADNHS